MMTLQQVCQLDRKNYLVVARKGRRGYGYSTLYITESMRRYAKNWPLPGRTLISLLLKGKSVRSGNVNDPSFFGVPQEQSWSLLDTPILDLYYLMGSHAFGSFWVAP